MTKLPLISILGKLMFWYLIEPGLEKRLVSNIDIKDNLFVTTAVTAYMFSFISKQLWNNEEQLKMTNPKQILSQVCTH